MDKISVIIPVYNVESYLEKCVDSVCNQSYKNLEIILVNDGSTDNSGILCEQFAKRDSRIKLIKQENGGISAARNVGIKQSSGNYLFFVDSDDFICDDLIEKLYLGLVDYECQIAIGKVVDCFGSIPKKSVSNRENYIASKVDAMRIVLEAKEYSISPVAKLYKREIFDTIEYPIGKTCEDAYLILHVLDKCKKVYFCKEQGYYYIHRTNSITTTTSSKMFDVIDAYEENYKFMKEKYPELLDVAMMRRCWARFNVLDKLLMVKTNQWENQKKEIILFLRENKQLILDNECFTNSRKIGMRVLLIHPVLYKALVTYHNRKKVILYEEGVS